MQLTRILLPLLCAVAPLAAQRTIIVDAAQGAGFDFSDIPPAIDAAQDGDTLLVRAGDYTPFLIDGKAISVLGEPGAVLATPSLAGAGFRINNLPAGRDVVVSGFSTRGQFIAGAFLLLSCEGRILIKDVVSDTSCSIQACAQVVLNRCTWHGALSCNQATVALSDCVGAVGATLQGSLGITSSTVTCARCTFDPGPAQLIFPPAPGIMLNNGTLRLAGDARHTVRAGSGGQAGTQISAIAGTGVLEIDPDIPLFPLNGAPPIAISVAVQTRELPALGAQAGALGETVSIELGGSPGDVYFLFWALAADALPFPFLDGDLWLDPQTIVMSRAGTLDQNGATRFDYRAPRLPGLVGAPFYWQGVAGTPVNLVLSNPAGYAHRP